MNELIKEEIEDEGDWIILRDKEMNKIEKMVLRNIGGGRIVIELRGGVFRIDIGKSMREEIIEDKERIEMGEVEGVIRIEMGRKMKEIGVVRIERRNEIGDDEDRSIIEEMENIGEDVDMMMKVGKGDRIKIEEWIVEEKNEGRIFKGDWREGLKMSKGNIGIVKKEIEEIGEEIIDKEIEVIVEGEKVMESRIFDLGVLNRKKIEKRRVKMVIVELRWGEELKIGKVRELIGDDKSEIEMEGVIIVDKEIGRKINREEKEIGKIKERKVGEEWWVKSWVIIIR